MSLGASRPRIIFREILPNLVAPIIVYATLFIPANILLEAALSFLGVGVQPPDPSWGKMLSDATEIFDTAWWYMFFPGMALLLTVLAFNLLGDGLQDALNPKGSRSRDPRVRLLPISTNQSRKDVPCAAGPFGPSCSPLCWPSRSASPPAAATTSGESAAAASESGTTAEGKQGGKLTMLWTDDVDFIDPGQTYYTMGSLVAVATQRRSRCTASSPTIPTTPVDGSRGGQAGDLRGRQDRHGEDQAGRQVLAARRPRGHVQGRQVRDRARLLQHGQQRLRRRLLRRHRRRQGGGQARHDDRRHRDAGRPDVVFKLKRRDRAASSAGGARDAADRAGAGGVRARSSTRRTRSTYGENQVATGPVHDREQRRRQGDRLRAGQAHPPGPQPELGQGARTSARPTSTRSTCPRATTTRRWRRARSSTGRAWSPATSTPPPADPQAGRHEAQGSAQVDPGAAVARWVSMNTRA